MRTRLALTGLSALAWAATSAPTPAFPDSGGTRLGAAAYGDWKTDAPGVRRKQLPSLPPEREKAVPEDLADSESYVRNLRKGTRLKRLGIV